MTVIVTVIVIGPAKPDFRYTDFLADQPNPILGTQTFWRMDKTEKPKNRKHNENTLKIY